MQLDQRIYFDPSVIDGETYAAATGQKGKDVLNKIGRLIPGEILGAYGAGLTALPLFSATTQPWLGIGWFVLGIAGTGWYVGWRIGRGFARQKHIFVYMGAFAVWAYVLTGPTVLPWIFHPGVAALLVPITGAFLANVKLPARRAR